MVKLFALFDFADNTVEVDDVFLIEKYDPTNCHPACRASTDFTVNCHPACRASTDFTVINAEFKRITTMPLQSKFLSQLDSYSDNLSRLFQRRGGQLGERLKGIVAELALCDDVDAGRECIIKGLCIYMGEDPENLIREYVGMDEVALEEALEGITTGIAVGKESASQSSQESGIPTQPILDMVIVIEGSKVVEGLDNVALTVVMLFGLMYAINLSYPSELRYTFEIIQKVFMELDAGRLSKKALTLKQRLLQRN